MTINTNIANQTKFQDLTGEEKRRAVVIEIGNRGSGEVGGPPLRGLHDARG